MFCVFNFRFFDVADRQSLDGSPSLWRFLQAGFFSQAGKAICKPDITVPQESGSLCRQSDGAVFPRILGIGDGSYELEIWEDRHQYFVFEYCVQTSRRPPFFILLTTQKRGNSRALDRINILKKFLEVFPKERIKVLLGDREFIGPAWISYLQEEKIPYCFRIKEDGQFIQNAKGQFVKTRALFHHLKCGEQEHIGLRKIGKREQTLSTVSATRSLKGELLVVMHSADMETPCEIYELRWSIECLFKGLKSNGFNLEDTHLTKNERIETLLNVLMIAFCYAYDWGQLQEPSKIKKHGYPQHSVFRVGLDALRRALTNANLFQKELLNYFQSLLQKQIHRFKSFVP